MRRALLGAAVLAFCAGSGGAAGLAGGGSAAAVARAAPTATAPPPLRLRERCVRRSDHATLIRFRASDGVRLIGVALGRGKAGVVLGHQSNDDLCPWLPFARRLAKAGFRAFAFDFRRHGSSAWPTRPSSLWRVDLDMAAAVRELRRRGATSVVLAGASMGGSAALAAGAAIRPPVAGVISVSAPAVFVSLDGVAAVRRATVPLLLVAAQDDGDFADAARALHAAAGSREKELHVLPGGGHGTGLLTGPRAEPLRRLLEDFIRRRSS